MSISFSQKTLARITPLPVLVLVGALFVPATPAEPSVDTPLCRSYVTNAAASMETTETRLRSLRGKTIGDVCNATRSLYLEAVKTRAVMALCKHGPDGMQDVGKLDATIEELDDVIASRCSSS